MLALIVDAILAVALILLIRYRHIPAVLVTVDILVWVLVAGSLLYLLPFGIAHQRRLRTTLAVFFVDLLLGWTVIGWIVALVMAVLPKPTSGS